MDHEKCRFIKMDTQIRDLCCFSLSALPKKFAQGFREALLLANFMLLQMAANEYLKRKTELQT
ncbi:hypothetical protein SRABI96_03513 [Peribacillus sp. Bi96]|uniref:hypothetical protein n=1 Tax=Peribacillus sp. Bi96 TaxID=2884273 RepID=UPI001D2BEE6F|nr:hypothetical protein [Peribacillus sp. Bi96]CAH0264337.1 hypothetical protein SRABI96_03513 [Peribacillus sp. Bi96]